MVSVLDVFYEVFFNPEKNIQGFSNLNKCLMNDRFVEFHELLHLPYYRNKK